MRMKDTRRNEYFIYSYFSLLSESSFFSPGFLQTLFQMYRGIPSQRTTLQSLQAASIEGPFSVLMSIPS